MVETRKATHQQTRTYNQRLVMRTIYDNGPLSRADVARITGLTRTSVSDLVGELLASGVVREGERGPSSGGKAPILLNVVNESRHLIGIDVGESVFSGAVVNLRGEIRHAVEIPLDGADGEAALELVFRLVETLIAAAGRPLLGIGVGAPGLVDGSSGMVVWAVNLDWRDLPLGAILAERFGVPVHVANDSHAAALAEYTFASDERRRNVVVVKVGRGIGSGIILDGRLFHGDRFGAGEIGHTTVVEDGAACRCGSFGCLETVASARAIVERAGHLAARAPDSGLHRKPGAAPIDLDDVAAAFAAGDEIATTVVGEAASHLGGALAAVVGVLNVERIVLVGEVAIFGRPWLEAVRSELRRRAFTLLARETEVELGRLGANDLVVLGASALLLTDALGLSLAR